MLAASGDLILQTEEFDHELVGSIISSVEKYCQPTAPEPLSPSRYLRRYLHGATFREDTRKLLKSYYDADRSILEIKKKKKN